MIYKYNFSFTGASALIAETLIVAEEYERLKDWEQVQKYLLDKNLLHKVKEATFKREFREIKKRLSNLSSSQLNVLINNGLDDAKAMILLSLVKTYKLVADFIMEVVRNKYLLFDRILTEVDYIKFYNSKINSHPELEALSESTAMKVKQRIFTLLEQVGLISQVENGTIIKPFLSEEAIEAILESDFRAFSYFLFSNNEIKLMQLRKINHVRK